MQKPYNTPENHIERKITFGKKFEAQKIISVGSTTVWKCRDVLQEDDVAIKVEPIQENHTNRLLKEYKVYKSLGGAEGIAAVRWYGQCKNNNILVLQCLGPSLENFLACLKIFSLATVLKLAQDIIARLAYIHSKGFIHRDIKPANFLLGTGMTSRKIFVIDFGQAKRYISARTKEHIQYREDKKLVGTARFASIFSHSGLEQSRRDDMESLGYMLIYLNRGSLPWQAIKGTNRKQRFEKISEIKMSLSVEKLCKDVPVEFILYFNYCRQMAFDEKPQYNNLINTFKNLFRRIRSDENEFEYDWDLNKQESFQYFSFLLSSNSC